MHVSELFFLTKFRIKSSRIQAKSIFLPVVTIKYGHRFRKSCEIIRLTNETLMSFDN